jgi:hypothetical protein
MSILDDWFDEDTQPVTLPPPKPFSAEEEQAYGLAQLERYLEIGEKLERRPVLEPPTDD